MKQKFIIVLAIIFIVISVNFVVLINTANAVNISEIKNANLQFRGECGQLLKYKGIIVKVSYVEYVNNNQKFPAYCLDRPLIRCN